MSSPPYGSQNVYASGSHTYGAAAEAPLMDRLGFIRQTYLHLAGAIGLFILIEFIMLTAFRPQLQGIVSRIGGWNWLIVLGAFMLVGWVAERWAHSSTSRGMQYAGLALYTVAEAIIFLPLLFIADSFFPGAILSAGVVTGVIFAGLTAVVFLTRTDFSFLRMGLYVAGLAAFAFMIVAILFQWPVFGALFATAMVVLASGYILYHTSNVLHHYGTEQYVAAALSLFASLALLFWYVLQLFMSLQQD